MGRSAKTNREDVNENIERQLATRAHVSLASNLFPYAGTSLIRFRGYNLSPQWDTPKVFTKLECKNYNARKNVLKIAIFYFNFF